MARGRFPSRKPASDARIRGALYKLHTEPVERRTSSRTMVRLKDGAALLTCGYSVGDTGFKPVRPRPGDTGSDLQREPLTCAFEEQ